MNRKKSHLKATKWHGSLYSYLQDLEMTWKVVKIMHIKHSCKVYMYKYLV